MQTNPPGQSEALPPLVLERLAYERFLAAWEQGAFTGQRLGQAFYNHFRLHAMDDQLLLGDLYDCDGTRALKRIAQLFSLV
ncbi:hypothetical protein HU751_004425 [Pseudomonas sp. BW13M1]|uniref:Uncharacterized protein n=1 Tax=Pseudomonas peradeniyensis TaxID=2745488 RepID=A0A923GC79_9PSED|nr:hypothetical protein [Pseudomonas peradeniyensis]MBV4504084.1 hypothetical protein [Pseudomonas peradeniyensis]